MTEIEREILLTAITLYGIVGTVVGIVAALIFALSLWALQPPLPGQNMLPPWTPTEPLLKEMWEQAQNSRR